MDHRRLRVNYLDGPVWYRVPYLPSFWQYGRMTQTLTPPAGRPAAAPVPPVNGAAFPRQTAQPTSAPAPSGAAPSTEARPRAAATSRFRRIQNFHGFKPVELLFYALVLGIAGYGNGDALHSRYHFLPFIAVMIALVLEVAGVVFADFADGRMRKGEKAIVARVVSAIIATGVAALNWFGHFEIDPLLASVYAGASLIAYVYWMFKASANRRDAQRAKKRMDAVAASFSVAQWITHPIVTRKAAALSKKDPGLGTAGSLEAIRLQKALGAWIRSQVTQANDKETADAMLAIYDPDQMAHELRKYVQWEQFAKALAGQIDPARVLAQGRKPAIPALPGLPVPTEVAKKTAAARKRVPAAITSAVRRTPAETRAAYDQLVTAQPGLTQTQYAVELGFGGVDPARGLRKALDKALTSTP